MSAGMLNCLINITCVHARFASSMAPASAIPDLYYFCFAACEPFLTIIGFLGALAYVDHDLQSSNLY